jgi:hypothetical protein
MLIHWKSIAAIAALIAYVVCFWLWRYYGYPVMAVISLDAWVMIITTAVSAVAAVVIAKFTIVLADVGRRQIADARILQRAYLSVEPKGIEWSATNGFLVGQVTFKNVGKLRAREFVSVVRKVEVHHAEWVTPILTDDDLPRGITPGLVPIGAEVPQGSEGITPREVAEAQVSGDKYLYVWGRATFEDGFDSDRRVNFCHRYPLAMKVAEPKGPGYSIPLKFGRYHQHGNNSD